MNYLMFPYELAGWIQDDFGNLIMLSNESWLNRWHIYYETSFYNNY